MDEFFAALSIDRLALGGVTLWLAYKEFRSGSSGIKSTIINDQATRIKQLVDDRDQHSAKRQEAEKMAAATNATIIQKDIQITDLKEQVAFRNPDLIQILSDMKTLIGTNVETNKQVVTFMQQNMLMMGKIKDEMNYQTGILEKAENRSHKIDHASAIHEGSIMRTPTAEMQPTHK